MANKKLSKPQQEVISVLGNGGFIEFSKGEYWLIEDKSKPGRKIPKKTFFILKKAGHIVKIKDNIIEDFFSDGKASVISSIYGLAEQKTEADKTEVDRLKERIEDMGKIITHQRKLLWEFPSHDLRQYHLSLGP